MASSGRPRRQCAPDERALRRIYDLEDNSEEGEETEEDINDSESDSSDDELVSNDEEEREEEEEEMEEVENEENGEQNSFLGRNGMIWNKIPPTIRRSRAVDIIRFREGQTVHTSSIFDSFGLFITEEIVLKIVMYTNLFAATFEEGWCRERWKDTNPVEIRAFIGCLLFIGVFRARHESYDELWSQDFGRSWLQSTMSLMRFKLLSKFIRFDDKSTKENRHQRDKLAAIRDVWEMFLCRCRLCYTVGSHVTIDEELVGFRGKCPFRVYMRSKPDRYGMKIWCLCDVNTGYLYNAQVYLGKEGHLPEIGQGQRVVLDLAQPLFGSGRNITTDNFFTSIPLTTALLKEKLTLLGTLRANKSEIPRQFQKDNAREVYSSLFAFTRDMSLVSYVPSKGKNVLLLSSMHHAPEMSTREYRKPSIILDYNASKGAVDTFDQCIHTYSSSRQTRRWPTKLFFNIVDSAAFNGFVMWTKNNPSWNSAKKFRRRLYLQELAKSLMRPLVMQRLQDRKLNLNTKNSIQSLGIEIPHPVAPEADAGGDVAARGRCHICPKRNQVKVRCQVCSRFVCKEHSLRRPMCDKCN